MNSYTKRWRYVFIFSSTVFGAILKNLGGDHPDAHTLVTSGWSNPVEGQKAALQFCREQNYTQAFKALVSTTTPVGAKTGKELIRACFQTESGLCFLGQKACAWMRKCIIGEETPCPRPPAKAIMDEFQRSKKYRHMLDGEEPDDAEFRGQVEAFDSKDMDMWQLVQGAWEAGINSLKSLDAQSMERLHGYGFIEETLFLRIRESYDMTSLKRAQEIAAKLDGLKRERLVDAVDDPKHRKEFLRGVTSGLFFTIACGTQYLHTDQVDKFKRVVGRKEFILQGGDWVC